MKSKSRRVKVCKNCGRSVRETVYNAGYCLRCISLAKLANSKKEARQ